MEPLLPRANYDTRQRFLKMLPAAVAFTFIIAVMAFAITETVQQAGDDLNTLELKSTGIVPGFSSWLGHVGGKNNEHVKSAIKDEYHVVAIEEPPLVKKIAHERIKKKQLVLDPVSVDENRKD